MWSYLVSGCVYGTDSFGALLLCNENHGEVQDVRRSVKRQGIRPLGKTFHICRATLLNSSLHHCNAV